MDFMLVTLPSPMRHLNVMGRPEFGGDLSSGTADDSSPKLSLRILPVEGSKSRLDFVLFHFREPFETYEPTA